MSLIREMREGGLIWVIDCLAHWGMGKDVDLGLVQAGHEETSKVAGRDRYDVVNQMDRVQLCHA